MLLKNVTKKCYTKCYTKCFFTELNTWNVYLIQ